MKKQLPECRLLEDYLVTYCVYLKKRRTYLEKKVAQKFIFDEYKKMGYNVTENNVKTGLMNTKILVAGSMQGAEKVYIAPFDTPRKILQKNYKFYPFDYVKNQKQENMDIFLVGIVFIILVSSIACYYKILFDKVNIGLLLIIFTVTWVFNRCLNNTNNFNRSSCTLALLNCLAKDLDDKVCFVFLDNCSENYLGLQVFFKKFKTELEGKELLYIDCIANGKNLVLARTDCCKKKCNLIDNKLDIHEKIYN